MFCLPKTAWPPTSALVPAPQQMLKTPKILYGAAMVKALTGDADSALRLLQKSNEPAVEKPAKTPAKAGATVASGAIEKSDASSLTLKTKAGKEEAFVINADTKIMQGTKAITAADLKAGENARVTYTKSGETMTATKIVVASAARPSKKGEVKK